MGLKNKGRRIRNKEVKKIENKKLLEASRKAFGGKEVKQENLKRFLGIYKELKSKDRLSEADKKAARKVAETYKKLVKEGRLKNV